MQLGDVKINFNEEQLKRFEAASARFPEPPEKQAPSSVTIEVPVRSGGGPPCRSIATVNLSVRQGIALNRLVHSLITQNALIAGKTALNRQDAIQWLLDQIADQMAIAKPARSSKSGSPGKVVRQPDPVRRHRE